MQLPLTLIRRGLLGFMDEQDQARGRADTTPAAASDDVFREPTLDYLGRQLALAGRHM